MRIDPSPVTKPMTFFKDFWDSTDFRAFAKSNVHDAISQAPA
jgi:hypothetical protein